MSKLPHVIKRRRTAGGDWLELEEIQYRDHVGKERSWECATRVNSHGAVMMIARLIPSNRLILVRQFRPPANSFVIEFPAGLIDENESPEVTAMRELHEETGFSGEVVKIISPALNSPGLSGESIIITLMTVDETAPVNRKVSPKPEETENIESFFVEPVALPQFIAQAEASGDLIDAKVIAFATGLEITP